MHRRLRDRKTGTAFGKPDLWRGTSNRTHAHIPFDSGCPLAVGGMIGGGIFIIAGVTLGVAGLPARPGVCATGKREACLTDSAFAR
jgi:hypothetical protein